MDISPLRSSIETELGARHPIGEAFLEWAEHDPTRQRTEVLLERLVLSIVELWARRVSSEAWERAAATLASKSPEPRRLLDAVLRQVLQRAEDEGRLQR